MVRIDGTATKPKPPKVTIDHLALFRQLADCLNILYYDGHRLVDMETERDRLDRQVKRRLPKLDNPALRNHPGFEQARLEYLEWNGRAIFLSTEIRVLTRELQRTAVLMDEVWTMYPPEQQRSMVADIQHWHPFIRELVKRWPEIRRLPVWTALLPLWASKYEEVPF